MYLVIFMMVTISNTVTLMICGFSPNATTAQAITPVFLVVNMLLCGFMVVPDDIPVYWEWMFKISFMTYGFRGLMINEFFNLEFRCDNDELVPPTDDDLANVTPPNGYGGVQTCPITTGKGTYNFFFEISALNKMF